MGFSVDGHVTLESVAAPGNYVGIDSEGSATVPSETDPSSETAHFSPNVKVYIYTPLNCQFLMELKIIHQYVL